MTHFIGAVIVPAHIPVDLTREKNKRWDYTEVNGNTELEEYLQEALEAFDENREVSLWVSKADLIAESRKAVEEYRTGSRYQEYLADPQAYANKILSKLHLTYIAETFPKKLEWTDEEHYQNMVRWENAEDIDPVNGSLKRTYNPLSKWDWWVIGGRWDEMYEPYQGISVAEYRSGISSQKAISEASGTELNKISTEVAVPEFYLEAPLVLVHRADEVVVYDEETNVQVQGYEWASDAEVGWFGYVSEYNKPVWEDRVDSILAAQEPGAKVVFVDFHI